MIVGKFGSRLRVGWSRGCALRIGELFYAEPDKIEIEVAGLTNLLGSVTLQGGRQILAKLEGTDASLC